MKKPKFSADLQALLDEQKKSKLGENLTLFSIVQIFISYKQNLEPEIYSVQMKPIYQKTDTQLLESVKRRTNLADFKCEVKNQLINGIPAAITLLRQHIATNTSTFDDLILIHGQYQRYHEDLTLYDVLSAEERRIGYNKIQKAVLELVNSLEAEDLKV